MASRLERDELLMHPLRATIYDVVRDAPGLGFLQMRRRLAQRADVESKLGFGNLQHHLYVLERNRFIVTRKLGRARRYYPNGGSWGPHVSQVCLLQNETTRRVALAVLNDPGATQRVIRQSLAAEVSRQAVGYHVARLERHELLVSARLGRSRAYYATELLARLIAADRLNGTLQAPTVAPVPVPA